MGRRERGEEEAVSHGFLLSGGQKDATTHPSVLILTKQRVGGHRFRPHDPKEGPKEVTALVLDQEHASSQ